MVNGSIQIAGTYENPVVLTASAPGSYWGGIATFIIAMSLMLSLKAVLKCILLLSLTGRAYNFSIVFKIMLYWVITVPVTAAGAAVIYIALRFILLGS